MDFSDDKTMPVARALNRTGLIGPRVRVNVQTRMAWFGIAVACVAVSGVARHLDPDGRGMGTHQQLGMPPCSFVLATGLPCPTCGMTTSFSLLMHGHPWSAMKAQPTGLILCLATIAMLVYSLYVVFTGWTVPVNWDRVGGVRVALGIGLLILGGWGFKIAHGLLTGVLPVK